MENVWDSLEDRRVKNRVGYYLVLVLIIAFCINALYIEEYESFLLAFPTLIIILEITLRGRYLFVPPLLILIMLVVMFIMQMARIGSSGYAFLDIFADFLMGFLMCLIGLIVVYTMIRSIPEFDSERSFFVTLTSSCVGFSLSTCIVIGNYGIYELLDQQHADLENIMMQLMVVAVGIAAMALLFYLNRHNGLFEHTLHRFLRENSAGLGIDEQERGRALRDIAAGESFRCEFKSTIRTNLETGEKDPRMEKAVLKTIVAFLNSRGGTLFIGVDDGGNVIGIDEASFESRDRMNLHMNNLLTSQIGSEYLPYINYRVIDFDDKAIMRVDCKRSATPVFLKEGKNNTFFVRSGPSSIAIEGMQLLYYVRNNFRKLPSPSESLKRD